MKRANGQGTISRIQKNGKKVWRARITIGINPKTGKPIRKEAIRHTQKDAVKALDELRQANHTITAHQWRAEQLGAWIDFYFQTYRFPNQAPQTVEKYKSNIRHIKESPLGKIHMSKLTTRFIQAEINTIAETRGTYAAKTALEIIKSAIRQAEAEEIIPKDYSANAKAPKHSAREKQALTKKEFNELYDSSIPEWLKIYILTAWSTGARGEELTALTWADVDTDQKTITINKATTKINNIATITKPKTLKSSRIITIPSTTAKALKEWKLKQPPNELNLVWATKTGKLMTTANINSALKNAERKTGVKTSSHTFRHAHATELYKAGTHPKDVATRLGHKSIKTTIDTYTHSDTDRQKNIAQIIDAKLLTQSQSKHIIKLANG